MNLKLTLPKALKDLPEAQRLSIVKELQKALDLNTKPENAEHSVWTRNDEELLADAEDELYRILITPALENMSELFAGLGLSNESPNVQKSLTDDLVAYEDILIKGKDSGQHKLSDLIELSKQKRQDFLKYIQNGSAWSKRKLAEVDRIMRQKLPDYATLAEEYAIRAAFIAKIRDKAESESLNMLGAFVDRFPKTIKAAQHDSLVLTVREKEQANREGKQVKILPLQPQEVRTVENADMRAAEKLTEISDRHRAGVKQVIMQAVNGRWSAQQLAQALFDQFGDQNRDWRRVAITELAMASNDAYIAGCSEGDEVIVPSVAGACKYCQKYLEGKTFKITHDPKYMGTTYLHEMEYLWVGKTNFGRKLAAWIPCVPLHVNCRHRVHKLSRFYKTDKEGKPVLKTAVELIQEERVRRGLGIDPNLK